MAKGKIAKRSLAKVILLTLITFGIYGIYWFYKTKEEINSLGAKIPSFVLYFIPIANIYWLYKYSEGFAKYVKKDNNTAIWFLVFWLVPLAAQIIVQDKLNKLAK